MRLLGWLALLTVPAFAGCLSFLDDEPEPRAVTPADVGYDPESVEVTGFLRQAFTVTSFDGTGLSVVAYVPTSPDALPDGSAPRWPVVAFLHGWGLMKETYEGTDAASSSIPSPPPESPAQPPVNRLEEFALAGLIAVAYDARGFGQSDGQATVAGPAEMEDLHAVLAAVEDRYDTNGFVGLLGQSYGAGQSLLALTQDPAITTAVSFYGWTDLYGSLVQGNVPKLEWAQMLYGLGNAGSRGRLHPMVHEWYTAALSRGGMDVVRDAMAVRSAGAGLQAAKQPIFACQGLQESLFPQIDLVWDRPAFTRAYVYTGGHGYEDEGCWDRALEWMRFFVGGYDTGVDAWPALEAQDAAGKHLTTYTEFPALVEEVRYLRDGELARAPSNTTFEVQQQILANPFVEPAGVWDQVGAPYNPVPAQFRQDPTAVFFNGQPTETAEVLLGAPTVRLALANGTVTPFQVTGILFHETAAGRSQVLSRGAVAPLSDAEVENGTVTLRFHWVHADLSPGDRLVLKLDANDPSWWYPYPGDYTAVFTGASEFRVPLFEG